MLTFFRTNQASAGLLLFVYALLLQLPLFFGWVKIDPPPFSGGLAGHLLLEWASNHFYLSILLPVIFVTGQGIVANTLVTRHRLSRKITQFPGLFIVLCWALVPSFRTLHPAQAAGFFLMLALLAMGRIYKKDEPAVPLFNAGAWLGLAVLFLSSYLLLIPAFIIGIGILRTLDLRSVFQFLSGLLTIFFLVFSVVYFQGWLTTGWQLQFTGLGVLQLPIFAGIQIAGLVALILLTLLVLFNYGFIVQLLNIEGKKNANLIIWVLLSLLLSALAGSTAGIPNLQIITVPLGLLVGLRFILFTEARAEFFHLVLFTIAFVPAIWSIFT